LVAGDVGAHGVALVRTRSCLLTGQSNWVPKARETLLVKVGTNSFGTRLLLALGTDLKQRNLGRSDWKGGFLLPDWANL